MKKVIIIGCPGSGKSTFARKLKTLTKLPLYHLDMLYWNADGTTVARDVFDSRLQNVMRKTSWIIDGNYSRTMERRMDACDTVFFLDYPTAVCLQGIEERKGQARSDIPWVEGARLEDDFVSFVRKFNTESRPEVLCLLDKYAEKNIVVFHSREEADMYLSSLTCI